MTDHTGTLVPFHYGDAEVRVVQVDGEPWWVAADVARILGYTATAAMTRSLDHDEKGVRILHTPGGEQEMIVISESGLYSTILRSRVERAADFRRWVTREVLPSIRRTGGYTTDPALAAEAPDDLIVHRALQITYRKVQELEAANAEMEPKAAYFDEFVADEDLILFRTLANQLELGEKALRETLLAHRWIYRVTGRRWSNKKNTIVDVHQYRAYADKKHLFRLVPCHDAPRVNSEVQQALKLTPAGAESVARAVRRWGSQAELPVASGEVA